ncbi:FAD-dependent oxidoreductase [Okeania sp. SIO2G5]|uniref:NAD(P)/FAD-dependent oxidoreductase n=1 Tax=Okeania sp. SIO2G5 TaxID=2607796 RepID=UPI00338F3021
MRGGDRQIDPKALTHALVAACQQRGVTFHFDAEVCGLDLHSDSSPRTHPHLVSTPSDSFKADWVIIAAGLGAAGLTQVTHHPVDIRPVLGQAMRVRLPVSHTESGYTPIFQPVLTGNDIHVIPLAPLKQQEQHNHQGQPKQQEAGHQEYWVGATVEFPDDAGTVKADAALFQEMWDGAIAFYPALAEAEMLEQWSGNRPRPFGRPAPIVESMTGYSQVILAAGHYRNGVLLAPATAKLVKELMGY